VQSRTALGARRGARDERVGRRPDPRARSLPGELCCDVEGFSLHARIAIEAHERDRLERLCRYMARPPIASGRLSLTPDGKVVYALRRHWKDGTAAIVFDPLTFIERLAALVPRPRAHLLTYHGVLAPAAEWRDLIVPRPPASSSEGRSAASSPSWRGPGRSSWAELLQRVFAIDALVCPHCGGSRKLIALIQDGIVARRILQHLGLAADPVRVTPARPPPEPELPW